MFITIRKDNNISSPQKQSFTRHCQILSQILPSSGFPTGTQIISKHVFQSHCSNTQASGIDCALNPVRLCKRGLIAVYNSTFQRLITTITWGATLTEVQPNTAVRPLHNAPQNIVFLWFIRVVIGPLVILPLLRMVSKPANKLPGGKYFFSYLHLLFFWRKAANKCKTHDWSLPHFVFAALLGYWGSKYWCFSTIHILSSRKEQRNNIIIFLFAFVKKLNKGDTGHNLCKVSYSPASPCGILITMFS